MNSDEIIGLSCTAFILSLLSGVVLSYWRHKKREKDADFIRSISLKVKLLENGDLDWSCLDIKDLIPVNVLKKNEMGNIYGNLL